MKKVSIVDFTYTEAEIIAELDKQYGDNYVILNQYPNKPSMLWNGMAPHGLEKMEFWWKPIKEEKNEKYKKWFEINKPKADKKENDKGIQREL